MERFVRNVVIDRILVSPFRRICAKQKKLVVVDETTKRGGGPGPQRKNCVCLPLGGNKKKILVANMSENGWGEGVTPVRNKIGVFYSNR